MHLSGPQSAVLAHPADFPAVHALHAWAAASK